MLCVSGFYFSEMLVGREMFDLQLLMYSAGNIDEDKKRTERFSAAIFLNYVSDISCDEKNDTGRKMFSKC